MLCGCHGRIQAAPRLGDGAETSARAATSRDCHKKTAIRSCGLVYGDDPEYTRTDTVHYTSHDTAPTTHGFARSRSLASAGQSPAQASLIMARARGTSSRNKGGRSSGRDRPSPPERDPAAAADASVGQATREFLARDEMLVEASRRRLEALKKAQRAREKRRAKGKSKSSRK